MQPHACMYGYHKLYPDADVGQKITFILMT